MAPWTAFRRLLHWESGRVFQCMWTPASEVPCCVHGRSWILCPSLRLPTSWGDEHKCRHTQVRICPQRLISNPLQEYAVPRAPVVLFPRLAWRHLRHPHHRGEQSWRYSCCLLGRTSLLRKGGLCECNPRHCDDHPSYC